MTIRAKDFSNGLLPGFDGVPGLVPGPGEQHQFGHRQRLRQRFADSGADTVTDDELLELVLYRAIPRREVKALSLRLLATFGDFNRVLSASTARLLAVQGVGSAVVQELKIVEAAAHRMAKVRVMKSQVLSSWDDLLAYCQTAMAHLSTEQFRILFLDRKNTLIADEVQQRGTVGHVQVYPREVVKRALELDASAIILVHNHPSGDTTPSDEDIVMTQMVVAGADPLGIVVHDHLIIGASGSYSFKSNGLM